MKGNEEDGGWEKEARWIKEKEEEENMSRSVKVMKEDKRGRKKVKELCIWERRKGKRGEGGGGSVAGVMEEDK